MTEHRPVAAPADPPVTRPEDTGTLETLQRNWSLEMDGVEMYAALEAQQALPARKAVFRTLGAMERRHADLWAQRITELGGAVPTTHSGKGHPLRTPDAPGGLREIVLSIEDEERRDVDGYVRQLRDAKDAKTAAALREVILDEYAQAITLKRLEAAGSPRAALDYLLLRKRATAGGVIGDAIYGVNDGLGAIFGIVSGVSGATLGNSHFVLLAGLAGMVASALSMGSGAFLAAKSEAEIYEAAVDRERSRLRDRPEEAQDELAVFYRLKGLPDETASELAAFLAERPADFIRTIAGEKLNLTEDALSNPVTSAVTGSVSTALGAFIPIVPFFFMAGVPAVIAAAVVSLVAHFLVGAAKSLVTARSWWSSGLEMTLVGAVEGVVTYMIGVGLGRTGA